MENTDLISRAKALNAIKNELAYQEKHATPGEDIDTGIICGLGQAAEIVKGIEPSAEKTGRWIPCEEKLPRIGEEVWATADGKSKIATLKERKTTFGDYIQEWWTEDDWIFQFEEVTAWQPLYRPHPYNCGVGMNQ